MNPDATSAQRPGSAADQPAPLQGEIIRLMPSLRAFARTLTRNSAEADDLLQETLLRALTNIHQFAPGTNLKAWLFAIVRNTFYSNYRKTRREITSSLEQAGGNVSEPAQEWSLKVKAVHDALERLPADQREALILIGGAGLSYEEAASVCGCALGTIKSRVSRGRVRLLELLDVRGDDDFLHDQGRRF
jgi:RNA polymerase sigma-70 factor (ECF subfamily)